MFARGAFCHLAEFISVLKGPFHVCITAVLIYKFTALMYIHSGIFVCGPFRLHGMCVSFSVLRCEITTCGSVDQFIQGKCIFP